MGIERRACLLVVVIAVVLVGAACGSSGSSGSSGTTTAAAPPATTTSRPSGQTGSECGDVVAKGQSLGTAVVQFVSGSATRDQVTAAAHDLGAAITAAQAVLVPAAGTAVSNAQADLRRLVDALQAQPVDMAGVRAAAGAVAADLRSIGALCSSTQPTAPPTAPPTA